MDITLSGTSVPGRRTWEVSLSGDASFSFMAVMRTRGAWPLMVLNWAWDANGDWNNASSSVRIFAFMGAKVRPLLR